MSDAFEDQARALAHSIPVCDLGSIAGIRAIAIGLRETWRMATEAAEEKSEKVIAGLNAQLTAEIDATGRFAARQITLEAKLDQARELGMAYSRDAKEAQDRATLLEQTIQSGAEMIRGLTARVEAAEAKDVTWRLAYLVGVDEPAPGRKIVAINDDGSAAMMFWVHDYGLIEAEGDECTFDWFKGNFVWWTYIPDSVTFWCETRAEDPMTLKRTEADFPSDGTCARCGAAPRNASGLCATCVDEDAAPADLSSTTESQT